MQVNKVFIVGSGLMGSGIAQVCAQAGLQVVLLDTTREVLMTGMEGISWSVGKLVEKGRLEESRETILDRISTTVDIGAAEDADLAIEVIFEDRELKQHVFKKLDDICKPETIFASNTSAISITELASVTKRPEQVIGLHFFSPVPMMNAVEVIKGVRASDSTMKIGAEFVKALGKEPIVVQRDVPGFLLNRIHLIAYVEAIRLLEQGIGTVDDIDKGSRLALGRKMGPFETGDMVGLDVSCGALMAIYKDSKDMRYYPPELLRRKVVAGQLGRKTGAGWYRYTSDGQKIED
jgi:3-hydroxybutyryl-CoA dehydrogenase